MSVRLKYLFLIGVLLVCQRTEAQLFAVNTDVAFDALAVPNIGFELGVGNKTSLAFNGMTSRRVLGEKIEGYALQAEYRYWLSGRPMHHHFVGIGAVALSYDTNWKSHIRDGNAIGAGITFGYVAALSSRWTLDFHAGFGIIVYKHKEYYQGDHYADFTQATNANGMWILPTRIGISLGYILK